MPTAIIAAALVAQLASLPPARGMDVREASGDRGRNLALVVGIDYKDAPAVRGKRLTALANAENDATEVAAVLERHYGFGGASGEIQKLLGEAAKEEDVRRELGGDRGLLRKAAENDRVIVYFAGHGNQAARVVGNLKKYEGVVYPYDVSLNEDGTSDKHLTLARVVDDLSRCKARHKLLILDSCHSGDVFDSLSHELRFSGRAATETDLDEGRLFGQPSFHVIASCQASQTASDGSGSHSPFTRSLLASLRTLPLHLSWPEKDGAGKSRLRFGGHTLYRAMAPDLRLLHGQSPECRAAEGYHGQFPFDAVEKNTFDKYRSSLATSQMLTAMVPGESTEWWFHTRPWFIPSLRASILENKPKEELPRNTLSAAAITEAELKVAAENYQKGVVAKIENPRPAPSGGQESPAEHKAATDAERVLLAFRLTCFKTLRQPPAGRSPDDVLADLLKEFKEVGDKLEKIAASRDGTTRVAAVRLQAADLHLYALLLHRSRQAAGPAEVDEAYKKALDAYGAEKALAHAEGRPTGETTAAALTALCCLDHGFHLLEHQRKPEGAADRFREALEAFRQGAKPPPAGPTAATAPPATPAGGDGPAEEDPAPFRVYVLCLEAQARQRMGRWGQADACFQSAVDLAEVRVGRSHPLTATALSQRGFNLLEQWKIKEAAQKFQESEAVLAGLPAQVGAAEYGADVLHLHNRHGLALAARLEGDSAGAARLYRGLSREIADKFARLRQNANPGRDAAEYKRRLIERWVNTLERQAECNLFGDPTRRDSAEAFDDLRRLLRVTYLLPVDRQRPAKPRYLYMQALALAADSPARDMEMARQVLAEAESLTTRELERWSGGATADAPGTGPEPASPQLKSEDLLRYATRKTGAIDKEQMWLVMYAIVARPTVTLLEAAARPTGIRRGADGRGGGSDEVRKAARDLREAVERFRELIHQDTQRDVLELFMFAARVLVDHGPRDDGDRYHILSDADLLLSLCRRAVQSGTADATQYLKPYYDTAIAAHLGAEPRQVKGLLEAVWEATEGSRYQKSDAATPVLVVYEVRGQSYALLDVPGGVSRYYRIDSTAAGDERRPLPGQLVADLEQSVPRNNAEGRKVSVECWRGEPRRVTGEPDPATPFAAVVGASLTQATPVKESVRVSFYSRSLPYALPECIVALDPRREDGSPRLPAPVVPFPEATSGGVAARQHP